MSVIIKVKRQKAVSDMTALNHDEKTAVGARRLVLTGHVAVLVGRQVAVFQGNAEIK